MMRTVSDDMRVPRAIPAADSFFATASRRCLASNEMLRIPFDENRHARFARVPVMGGVTQPATPADLAARQSRA
jgi:hypothetical protein